MFPEGEKEKEVPEADLVSIPLDKKIIETLRKV